MAAEMTNKTACPTVARHVCGVLVLIVEIELPRVRHPGILVKRVPKDRNYVPRLLIPTMNLEPQQCTQTRFRTGIHELRIGDLLLKSRRLFRTFRSSRIIHILVSNSKIRSTCSICITLIPSEGLNVSPLDLATLAAMALIRE